MSEPQEMGLSELEDRVQRSQKRAAFWMCWLGIANAVLGMVIIVYASLSLNQARTSSRVAAQVPSMTPSTLQEFVGLLIAVILIVTGLLATLWVWLVIMAYRRRNWARVTLTVLAAVWFLLSIPSLFGGMAGGAATVALVALQMLFLVANVVSMYTLSARLHFTDTVAGSSDT